jgi:hypothetical protein
VLPSTALRRDRLAALALPGTVSIGARPAEPVRRVGTGIPALDALLDGGLPRGHLSEIVGAPSSGRTALLGALLAAATRRGEVVAVVDLPDALHPESLQRAGVALRHVLWVRPPDLRTGLKCTEQVLAAGGFGLVAVDLGFAPLLPAPIWFRLARVARKTGTAMAILAPQRVAGSVVTLSVALAQRRVRWRPGAWRLFDGFTAQSRVVRSRYQPAAISSQLSAISFLRSEGQDEELQETHRMGARPLPSAGSIQSHQLVSEG